MIKKLEDMTLPEDIKRMKAKDLKITAIEIRDFLLSNISKTGGHLASNLGVVELTLALHKVFDTSKDRIIWDVGHQSYIHKILTGRMDRFSTLRQLDGLSGFPKRSESLHDAFDTGHSSTSVSVAQGMAVARDTKGEDYNVIAVIGDGALTGGLAYEGLNNLGSSKSKVIVILNDNGMSIRPNTGGISDHLSKLRVSRKYYAFKGGLKRAVKRVPCIGDGLYYGASKMRDIVKYALVDGVFFEELGFTYLGPIDGHDIDALTENLEAAVNSEKPCVIHIMTQKGKGYRNAEKNPDVFHGTGPFEKDTGLPVKCGDSVSYSDAFGMKMVEMAEKDQDIIAVSAAMIDGVGLEGFAKQFPDRIFDAGIAEQHAVSFAAGMACQGLKPVVAVYSTFLQRAYDQIVEDVCMQELPVIFAIDRAGVVGPDGETHNGVFDISYLSHIPGLTVMAPSDKEELHMMMEHAYKLNRPVAIRYPRGKAEEICSKHLPIEYGPEKFFDGNDVHIWALGQMVTPALDAARLLDQKNIKCSVINARYAAPIEEDIVRESADACSLLVTVEDNVVTGGFGSGISRIVAESNIDADFKSFGWPEKFLEHGEISELFERYSLDGKGLAERISEIFEGKA